MDSKGGLRWIAGAVIVVVAAACSSPQSDVPVEPAPAPAAVVAPPVETHADLRAMAQSADPATHRRGLAMLGLALFEDGSHAEAIRALNEAVATYPEVAPFLRLRVMRAEEARGNLRQAAVIASELIAQGNTSAATVARLRLPAILAEAGDSAAAEIAFRQAMSVPIDELTEQDFIDLGKRLAKANRADLASELRMRLLTTYTSGRYTEQLYGQLSPAIDQLSLDESVRLAQKLAGANRYDQALDLLGRIGRRFPGAVESQALYRTVRLRALFNSRNYTTLVNETPDASLTDPSLILMRARAAWRDDRPQEMLAGIARLEREFPTSKETAEALVVRSKYYQTDVTDYAKSVADLEKAIAAGAVGNDGENLWTLGWTYTLWGRDDDALKTFDRYIRSYPDGDYKTNSLFWAAKIHDRNGRPAERDAKARQVIAEYPYSYYAYRAKELWNVTAEPAALTANVFPALDAELAKVTDPRLATVRELLEIGMKREATREMKLVAAAYPDNAGVQFMLADTYVQGGEPFKANGILQRRFREFVRHGGSNVPQRFWQILYPLSYFESMKAEAEKRGADPYLIASITRQESGFEPTTVSNAGAVGLMQIMPAEAARLGEAAGIPNVTRESLFDPATNIAVGVTEYLLKLRRMQNNPALALAAYNAGETAVDGWLARTPINDLDVFIESIPYAETKLYVKTVTRNRNEYRRIYGG